MAAKYKYSGDGVIDTERGCFIPNDERNRDWNEYLLYDGTTDPEFTQVELDNKAWDELRSERDGLLAATDFMMTQDYYNDILSAQEQTDVKTYRSDLRDLPGETSDPHNVTWPTKPQIVIDNGI
jgi:hypothetical protein